MSVRVRLRLLYRCAAVFTWAGAAAWGCGSRSDDASRVERVDSAGVEIVTSGADHSPLTWTFTADFALGGAVDGPETFHAVSASSIAVDATGHLWILDRQSNRVVEFSASGDHVQTMGREGQGPGELLFPASITVSTDGTVSVFDYGRGGLVRFDVDGSPLGVQEMWLGPWPGQNRHMASTSEGLVVAAMAVSPEPDHFRYAIRRIAGADTVVLAAHDFPRPTMARYESCGGGLNLPRVFETSLPWTFGGGRIAVAPGSAYDISILGDSATVRRVRRAIPARSASELLAIEQLEPGFRIDFGMGPCTIPPRDMVEARGFAEHVPAVADLTLASDGELWVRRFEVGTEATGPIDIFDVTGAYVGTLPATAPFPMAFLPDGRLVGSETDEFDVTRVVVYIVDRTS